MSESFQDRLATTLKRKRDLSDAAEKRRAEQIRAAEAIAAERAAFEQTLSNAWQNLKVQLDEQIKLINQTAAELNLVVASEERAADAKMLATRIVQFHRRSGSGRFDLVIQLARTGIVQYWLDKKVIYSGKIMLMNTADHDLVAANVLDYIVSGIPFPIRHNEYKESRRARVWRDVLE